MALPPLRQMSAPVPSPPSDGLPSLGDMLLLDNGRKVLAILRNVKRLPTLSAGQSVVNLTVAPNAKIGDTIP